MLEQYLRYYINYIQNNQAALLPIIQFVYNTILQKGLGTLLFKVNYGYKLKILLMLRQAKKMSKTAKERMEKLIQLYKNLYKLVKLV